MLVLLFTLIIAATASKLYVLRLSTLTSYKTCERLSNMVYASLMYDNIEMSDKRSSGSIIATLTSYVNHASGAINQMVMVLVSSFTALIIAGTLLYSSPLLTLVIFIIFLVVYLWASLFLGAKLTTNGNIIFRTQELIAQEVNYLRQNLRSYRIYSQEEEKISNYGELNNTLRTAQFQNTYIAQVPRSIVEFLLYAGICLLLLQISLNKSSIQSLASVSVILLGGQKLLPLFQQIYGAISALRGTYPSLRTLTKFVRTSHILSKPKVHLKNSLYVQISGQSNETKIHFTANSINGLTGTSGSGKTTLVECILGIRNTLPLMISSNDTNFFAPSLETIHNFSYLEQNPFLPYSTFEEYLDHFSSDDLALVDKYLLKFGLSQLKSLDIDIGENGCLLSGGERQRLRLIQCLINPRPFIILDEPTSKLDLVTQEVVLSELKLLCSRSTIILITHSASALHCCDKIIKLELPD